jgi:hypothetical protein
MKSDITKVIADLVLQTDPELASRLDYQAEALLETKCTNPVVGRWVDDNDVKYLLATFALGDKDFAETFPAMAFVNGPQRGRLLATIEAHFEHCPHCALKRGYDLEWDARIKQVCGQNSPALLQLLRDKPTDESIADGDESPVTVPA